MLGLIQNVIDSRGFRFLASVKFAIPVLVLLAISLVYGTIVESLYGTPYAGRNVYFTWWFFALQGGVLVSLIFAVLVRTPFRSRLIGFYFIHTGLVTIIVGSIITRIWGIDGQITLAPKQSNNRVQLNEDVLYLTINGAEKNIKLPFVGKEIDLNEKISEAGDKKIFIRKMLPWARMEQNWVKGGSAWVSKWILNNGQVSDQIELSSESIGNLSNTHSMGPMKFAVVSYKEFLALKSTAARGSGFLVKDVRRGKDIEIGKIPFKTKIDGGDLTLESKTNQSLGLIVYLLKAPEGLFKYFPSFSPFPVADHLNVDENAPYQLFDLGQKSSQPKVILSRSESGKIWVGYGKGKDWTFQEYQNKAVPLPWMGITLTLLQERIGERPEFSFYPMTPTKDDKGLAKAVEIEVESGGMTKKEWFSDRSESELHWGDLNLGGFIGTEIIRLPFDFTLNEFKMDNNPGTMEAASYESFVTVSDTKEVAHIYMNHPLKKGGFTFYQSSYFQDEDGKFHSVLSVNSDPGRWVKYLGSLILVLAMFLHYLVIHNKIQLGVKK